MGCHITVRPSTREIAKVTTSVNHDRSQLTTSVNHGYMSSVSLTHSHGCLFTQLAKQKRDLTPHARATGPAAAHRKLSQPGRAVLVSTARGAVRRELTYTTLAIHGGEKTFSVANGGGGELAVLGRLRQVLQDRQQPNWLTQPTRQVPSGNRNGRSEGDSKST